MEFFVHKLRIHGKGSEVLSYYLEIEMTKTEKFCTFLMVLAAGAVFSFVYWALLNSIK